MELELYASSSDLEDFVPPTPDLRSRPGTMLATPNPQALQDPSADIQDTPPRSGRSPHRSAPPLRGRGRRRSSPAPIRGSARSSGSSHATIQNRRDSSDNPIYWTVARIRSTLHARGVAFHRRDRKFHLLRLLAQSDPAHESGSANPGIDLDAARPKSPDVDQSAPSPVGRSTNFRRQPAPAPLPSTSAAPSSLPRAKRSATQAFNPAGTEALASPLAATSNPQPTQPPPQRRRRLQSAPVATALLLPPAPLSLPHLPFPPAVTSSQAAPLRSASGPIAFSLPQSLSGAALAPAVAPPLSQQLTGNISGFQPASVATASPPHPFPPPPPAETQSLAAPLQLASGSHSQAAPPLVGSVPTAPSLPHLPPTHFISGAVPDLSASSGSMYQTGASAVPFRLPTHTLVTATPLPPSPHAAAFEPPPVSSSIRNLILSGADVDLSTLLPSLPTPAYHRDITCGDLILSLNSSGPATKLLFPRVCSGFFPLYRSYLLRVPQ